MTSIPVGDFVFDHGRSCIEARTPVPNTPTSSPPHLEDQNQTPRVEPPTDKTTTFHDGHDLFANSRTTRRSTLYGVSILRKRLEKRNSSEEIIILRRLRHHFLLMTSNANRCCTLKNRDFEILFV